MQTLRVMCCLTAVLALCAFMAPVEALSQIPRTISYQGVLATAGDPPEIVPDADYDLTFKIYDVATAGTALWTEVHVAVPVEEGRFHVILGRGLPFTNIPFNKPYWLGITVGAGSELPRIELTAAPYCLTARGVEADGVTSASIGDGTILFADIAQNAAEDGDVMTWDGEAWVAGSPGPAPDCDSCDDRFVNVAGDEITGTLHLRKPVDDVNLAFKKSTGETRAWIKADEAVSLITYHANSASHDFEAGGAPICAFFDAAIQVTGNITATGSISGDIDHGGLDGLDGDDHPQYVLDAGDAMTGTLTLQKPVAQANLVLKKSDGTAMGYIQAEEGSAKITYHGNDKAHNFEAGTSPTCAFFDGNVEVTGDLCATGSIGACSDARYKKDVQNLQNPLQAICALRGVTYRWRRDEFPDKRFDAEVHTGFIAQEIQKVLPDAVTTDSDGYLAVDYSRVTPLLVEAIKEQQKEIDELRAMVELLLAGK